MKKTILSAISAMAAAGWLAMAGMAAQGALRTYYATDPVGRNVLMIWSRAPLETMLTRTNQISGEIKVDPENLAATTARLEVDMASLDTGIPLRNEHMRAATFLDTAKYPKAIFVMEKVLPPADGDKSGIDFSRPIRLVDNTLMSFRVQGSMTFHGTTRPVLADCSIRSIPESEETKARLPGDILHIQATFKLPLDQYGVQIAAPAQLKIANEQEVSVDLFTSTEPVKVPAAK